MKGRYRYINKKNRDNKFYSHTIESEVVKIGYTVLHTRKGLSKAWLGYTIAKNKGDRWTNEKRRIDEEWYYWQTALKLIQGYGRSIRSKEDWAKTYVLDSAFGYFVKKNKNILPDWFTQAIQAR
jgi:hypothetical protein